MAWGVRDGREGGGACPQDCPPELRAVTVPAWSREDLIHGTRWGGCLVPARGWPRWRGLLAVCPARSSVAGQSAQQVTTQTFTPTTRKLETQRKAINLSNTLKMLRNKSGHAEASRETILKADLKT